MRHDGIGENISWGKHQRKLPKALTTVTIINISINQTQTFSGKVKKKDFETLSHAWCMKAF